MKEDFILKPYSKFNFFINYIILSGMVGSFILFIIETLLLYFTKNLNLQSLKFIGISILIYLCICVFYFVIKKILYQNTKYEFSNNKFIYYGLFGLKKQVDYPIISKSEVIQSEYQDKYDIGDILFLDNKNKKIICLKNVEDVFDNVIKIMEKISK